MTHGHKKTMARIPWFFIGWGYKSTGHLEKK